jgi:hypothetical protein
MQAAMSQDTLGAFIRQGFLVTRYCETCKDHDEVELGRIFRAKAATTGYSTICRCARMATSSE